MGWLAFPYRLPARCFLCLRRRRMIDRRDIFGMSCQPSVHDTLHAQKNLHTENLFAQSMTSRTPICVSLCSWSTFCTFPCDCTQWYPQLLQLAFSRHDAHILTLLEAPFWRPLHTRRKVNSFAHSVCFSSQNFAEWLFVRKTYNSIISWWWIDIYASMWTTLATFDLIPLFSSSFRTDLLQLMKNWNGSKQYAVIVLYLHALLPYDCGTFIAFFFLLVAGWVIWL